MTAQLTNPLMGHQPTRPGRVAVDMLNDLAARLNRAEWVRDSGFPYFVNSRVEEGKGLVHFLDRRLQKQYNSAS